MDNSAFLDIVLLCFTLLCLDLLACAGLCWSVRSPPPPPQVLFSALLVLALVACVCLCVCMPVRHGCGSRSVLVILFHDLMVANNLGTLGKLENGGE